MREFSGRVIPNSIPLTLYKSKESVRLKPKLLYVRAFARIYNLQMALRVLREPLWEFHDAELFMVGSDNDGTLNDCKELAGNLDLEKSVRFVGRLSKEKWHDLAKSHDIFINTTNKDNTPVSVMESVALGLPVVSTNPGGIPFLIEHERDGLLVDVNDVEAMVAKIRFLLRAPNHAISLSETARSKVEGFDWDKVKLNGRSF